MSLKLKNGKVPKKQTPPRVTTHKDRATWFQQRAVFPLRDAPPTELERAWAELAKSAENPEHQWEEAGPINIAGRVTSLVVHQDYPERIYAGSAGGGVWRTDDAGLNWRYSWDQTFSQNIGALAINPMDPGGLIAATGHANLSPDTYPGTGFYLWDNLADKWRSYFQTEKGDPLPEAL